MGPRCAGGVRERSGFAPRAVPAIAVEDYLAAVLLGLATFSKPTHAVMLLPAMALMLMRRSFQRLIVAGVVFVAVVAGLFAVNAAVTGEFSYQGGLRKTFYSGTGFPFANTWETFDNRGQLIATDAVPFDILLHRDTATVLLWDIYYFTLGRYSGLVPYFFPGVLAALLFLKAGRDRERWQWAIAAGIVVGTLALLAYMPYTYSGGGGPIGNRYFLSFYPLFLFLMPPLRSAAPTIAALAIGCLFTAKLVLNPFYTSSNPGEHAKSGPLRLLPIELTLLNDLPVGAEVDRARRSLGGIPPVAAYFPDDGAYVPEGDSFWVRGKSRADVLLRAAAPLDQNGQPAPLQIRRLMLEVTNGSAPNHVVISAGFRRVRLDLAAGDATVDISPRAASRSPRSIHELRLRVLRLDQRRVRAIPRRSEHHRQPGLGALVKSRSAECPENSAHDGGRRRGRRVGSLRGSASPDIADRWALVISSSALTDQTSWCSPSRFCAASSAVTISDPGCCYASRSGRQLEIREPIQYRDDGERLREALVIPGRPSACGQQRHRSPGRRRAVRCRRPHACRAL